MEARDGRPGRQPSSGRPQRRPLLSMRANTNAARGYARNPSRPQQLEPIGGGQEPVSRWPRTGLAGREPVSRTGFAGRQRETGLNVHVQVEVWLWPVAAAVTAQEHGRDAVSCRSERAAETVTAASERRLAEAATDRTQRAGVWMRPPEAIAGH